MVNTENGFRFFNSISSDLKTEVSVLEGSGPNKLHAGICAGLSGDGQSYHHLKHTKTEEETQWD